jgi:hypothetical protein
LLVLASTLQDFKGAFGKKGEVDPVRHLIGAAAAWGGNPAQDAIYLNVTPSKNDGTTVYKLDVKDVPVDGFWSVTVYDAEGYLQANPYNAYSLNNITAKKKDDGSFAIQFGGSTGKSRIVCQSRKAGTIRCGFIVRDRRLSMAVGSFPNRRRSARATR